MFFWHMSVRHMSVRHMSRGNIAWICRTVSPCIAFGHLVWAQHQSGAASVGARKTSRTHLQLRVWVQEMWELARRDSLAVKD